MVPHSHPNKIQDSCIKHPSTDVRLDMLYLTLKRYQYQQDTLIEILHQAQDLFGYLDTDLLWHVAQGLRLPLSQIYGVATFYHLFSLLPRGTHHCLVCTGTACYVKGSATLLATVEQSAHIRVGETTPDGHFSISTAYCLGTCGLAPLVVLDSQVYGYLRSCTFPNKPDQVRI